MSADVDQLQRKPVKSSEASRDLNGYLEPLTHMCTVLNIANESCIRSQEMTLAQGSLFLVESLFARVHTICPKSLGTHQKTLVAQKRWRSQKFLIIIFLTQLNFIPTCRDRVLDLAIRNVPDRARVREVLSPKESDVFPDHAWHGVFSISRLYKSYSQNKRTVYDYSNGVFDRLRGALEALNLCNLIQDSDNDNLD